MKAQNRMYAPALQYGLSAARAVGRQERLLRQGTDGSSFAWDKEDKTLVADLLNLEKVGLVGIFRDRRSLVAWSLTANGRALFRG